MSVSDRSMAEAAQKSPSQLMAPNVQILPFDQQNVVAGRSEYAGSSACVLFHVTLALDFVVQGVAALPRVPNDWKNLLEQIVKEFDKSAENREGSVPQPLLIRKAMEHGIEISTLELPMPQFDLEPQLNPDTDEMWTVRIEGVVALTQALKQVNVQLRKPYVVLLTCPKFTSGANTFSLYIDKDFAEVIDTHPKYRSCEFSPESSRLGMYIASFPSNDFDSVAHWLCESLVPLMSCQRKFDLCAVTSKSSDRCGLCDCEVQGLIGKVFDTRGDDRQQRAGEKSNDADEKENKPEMPNVGEGVRPPATNSNSRCEEKLFSSVKYPMKETQTDNLPEQTHDQVEFPIIPANIFHKALKNLMADKVMTSITN